MNIVITHIPLLIKNKEVSCIGILCPKSNGFFVVCNYIVRNKSPPSTFEFLKIWMLEV